MRDDDAPDGPAPIEWLSPTGTVLAGGTADEAPDVVTHGPTRRRRRPVRIALASVAVAAAVGGVALWQVRRDTAAHLTWQGATIAHSSATLRAADTQLRELVRERHGVAAASSRCYFVQPGAGSSGGMGAADAPASDVGPDLLCGPVLFYDGTPGQEYVSYALGVQPRAGADVQLTPSGDPVTLVPAAPPPGSRLVRPDRRRPPDGASGLRVPVPPPAARDTFVAVSGADLPGLPPAPRGSVLGGRDAEVVLAASGTVTHYGVGAAERSTPPGRRLLAFELLLADGEVYPLRLSTLQLGLSIDGGPPRPLPISSDVDRSGQFFVAAVPRDARRIDLVLTDAGLTQRISAVTGQPGAGNILVLRRTERMAGTLDLGSAVATVDDHGRVFTAHLSIRFEDSVLGYFTVFGTRPPGPDRAFLYTDLCYYSDDFADSTTCHNFRPSDLTLVPDNGRPIQARPVAPRDPDGGYPVFDVPANFTGGTVRVSGSETDGAGWTMTITRPYEYHIDFAP